MSSPSPGTTISHYKLLKPIGEGGMGEVWLAEDTELPRRLAIKFLSPHLAANDTAVKRMIQEARATASIDHPAVATIFEVSEFESRPFLVMQYFDGETLEQRVSRLGVLDIQEALALVREMADALAEVHALGIVHRDLKTSNIMLTPRGPRILDFGLASIQERPRLTQDDTMVGTPVNMSPEQLSGGQQDNRTDLWGLGVILYEILVGKLPFQGATTSEIFQRILHEQPARPSTLRAEVDPELEQVVMKLLRKDPAHRYPRAEDLLVDLVSCQAQTANLTSGATIVVSTTKETIPRLAVVPFDVMSTDPDDKYLASGLVEDLIVDLARIKDLYVPSRAEVAPYAERNVPPRTLARELSVDYLLLGSVRRLGNRARINANLVRAGDGHTIWADRFDRTIEDLFAIQEEVSQQIVSALQVALRPGESEILKRAPTIDTEAYKLYLKALELLDNNRESNLRAERLLKDALILDPKFALAHAALGRCYVLRPTRWWGGLQMIELANQCITRALALDPNLPDAVQVDLLAKILTQPKELLPAIESVIAVSPDDAPAMVNAAWGYLILNRPMDAIPILEKLTDRYEAVSWLSNAYEMLGREEDLKRMNQRLRDLTVKAIERDPEAVHERSLLAGMLARDGESEAAIHQAERAVALDLKDGRIRYNAACAYSRLDQPEKAIEHLKQALANLPSVGSITWLKHDPDLKAVRRHPAFKEISRLALGEPETGSND